MDSPRRGGRPALLFREPGMGGRRSGTGDDMLEQRREGEERLVLVLGVGNQGDNAPYYLHFEISIMIWCVERLGLPGI